MKVRRRFLIALMVSVLLHLGVVTGQGGYLPSPDALLKPKPPVPTLDTWLVKDAVRPAAPSPPQPKPRHRSRPRPKPAPQVAASLPLPPQLPEQALAERVPPVEREEPAGAGSDTEATAPAPADNAPSSPVLYGHVWIRYSVAMGESGFVIGEATQEFRNDGQHYFLRSETGTTGLARMFKAVRLVHTSEGDIVDNALRPRQFLIERLGEADKWAYFDWVAGEVSLSEGGRRFPLEPGTQDMLSMFCQLALMPIEGRSVTVPVVTSKKVEQTRFDVLGEEILATPMGDQPTVHLRSQGDAPEATDIWLGINYARLPLRIRHVDRKGDLFDQVAGSVAIDPDNEAPH